MTAPKCTVHNIRYVWHYYNAIMQCADMVRSSFKQTWEQLGDRIYELESTQQSAYPCPGQ